MKWFLFVLFIFFPAMAMAGEPADVAELSQRLAALEALIATAKVVAFTVLGFFGLSAASLPLYLRRQITKRVEGILDAQAGALTALVGQSETDARLRRDSQILVVAPDSDRRLQQQLLDVGFARVMVTSPEAWDPTEGGVDLVVCDGYGQDLHDKVMDSGHGLVVVFTSGFVDRKFTDSGRLALANMPVTLYTRVMEVLRYNAAAQKKLR